MCYSSALCAVFLRLHGPPSPSDSDGSEMFQTTADQPISGFELSTVLVYMIAYLFPIERLRFTEIKDPRNPK